METLLHAGLSNAVSATFLALLVACLSRVLARRPAVLHCLWLLVLLKLVTPPIYEVPVWWPETLTASSEPAAPAELAPDSVAAASLVYVLDVGTIRNATPLNDFAGKIAGLDREPPLEESVIASARLWLSVNWMPIVAAIWLTGTIATVTISVRRILRFQILLREARPGSDDIQDWVDELSAGLGIRRPPQVWWIDGTLSPMLWAVFGHPRLIIPTDLWKSLNQRQRATLLVHELAHLRRGDHRVRIFELAVTALYWWNPILWWARQAMRDVEEQCCDAWVVWAFPEAAKSYAETLLETLDFLNRSEFSEPLLASGFGKVQHLRRRLTMIMSGTTPRLVSMWGALGALSLGALLLPVNATWAQKPEERKEVRVIVNSDDAAKTVFVPAGEITATGTFVVADDPTAKAEATGVFVLAGEADKAAQGTFVIAGEPTGTFVVSDDVTVTDDGKSERVNVVVKTDDTSVSVSADSIEEARKKISDQIKAIKQKGSLGDKERAKVEALSSILKQLEKVVKADKVSAKGDGKTQTRFVYRKVEDGKTSVLESSPEKKAQIEKARAKVNELSKALAAAHADLAKLEGHAGHGVTFFSTKPDHASHGDVELQLKALPKISKDHLNLFVGKKVEGDVAAAIKAGKMATVKVQPKVSGELKIAPKREIQVRTIKVPKGEEDRIQALEKKLNQLLEEVAGLKKSKGD